MSNSNSDNPKVGKAFQDAVQQWFEKEYPGKIFKQEEAILIGNPAKLHKFDISSDNPNLVIECKCYTWTDSGNVPSAKMAFLNEASLYLSLLPEDKEKIIVMKKSYHQKRGQTLAEYYFETNRFLLGNIKVMEYDTEKKTLTLVGQNS